MSQHNPQTAAHRETTAWVVRAELDALVSRLGRLAQAGVITGEHRETLHTIAEQLNDIQGRLCSDEPRLDPVIHALKQVAEHVDDLASTHKDCVYGPVLTELAERIAAAVDLIR